MSSKDLKIKEILKQSWKKTIEHIWFLVGVQIAAFALNTVANFSFLGFFVSILVGAILYQVFIRINRGENTTFKNLLSWMSVDRYFQYLLVGIIVAAFVLVGTILLVVPGIIVAVMLSMASFIVLDKDSKISWKDATFWKAIKKSKKMTKGFRWKIFWFFVLSVLINILGLIALGVGLLVTIPLTGIAFAEIYDRLKSRHVEAEVIN